MARTGKLGAVSVVLAVVLAVALLALLATPPAGAASRYRIVTKTFSSAQTIAIPAGAPSNTIGAAAPYPSERNVRGFKKGKIRDVNLTLKNYRHTWPHDVDVMLSHRGVNRTVMSDVGGNFDVNDITLKLDDEATNLMDEVSQLTAGRFKPTNNGADDAFPSPAPFPSGLAKLSGFDGKNPNGPWSLWVVDDGPGDAGRFAGGWSITIKARVLR